MELTVPGDKSISHRALLLAALADGESRLSGLLAGEDPTATASILRALGVDLPRLPSGAGAGGEIRIPGVGLRGLGRGGIRPGSSAAAGAGKVPSQAETAALEAGGTIRAAGAAPAAEASAASGAGPASGQLVLDCGNSGTTARLLMGLLAGTSVDATVTGDPSLRSRPMRRVTLPLSTMGAAFEELGEPDRLPVRVRGGKLQSIEYETPVASAQVKSALLLAGVTGGVFVLITEPGRSRDHTERMLRLAGVPVLSFPAPQVTPASTPASRPTEGWRVELREPPERLRPLDFRVPGDFSSTAFPAALALLGGAGRELVLRDVGLNPTRTGLLSVLERMGADLRIENASPGDRRHHDAGEPKGDLVVRPGELRGTTIEPREIPGLVDEIPILAVLAARASGITRITGAAELRVKESDRLTALAENLRAIGVGVEELPDGLEVEGSDHPLEGRVRSFRDHRIAMAFGVLAALPGNRIGIDDPGVVEVSYPDYWTTLRKLGEQE